MITADRWSRSRLLPRLSDRVLLDHFLCGQVQQFLEIVHRNICSAETHPSLMGERSAASSIM